MTVDLYGLLRSASSPGTDAILRLREHKKAHEAHAVRDDRQAAKAVADYVCWLGANSMAPADDLVAGIADIIHEFAQRTVAERSHEAVQDASMVARKARADLRMKLEKLLREVGE